MERALHWPDCINVRDLGGLAADGGRTRAKALVRADNLLKLTPAGRAALLAHGIRTVVDLRDPKELVAYPSGFASDEAVRHVSAPLISQANWAAIVERPRPPHEADVLTLELSAANIATVLETIAGAPAGGVVFHCNAGLERTGLVALLLLSLAGASDADIVAEHVASARSLTPLFEEWAAGQDDERRASLRAWVASVSDSAHVLETLAYLRRRGGPREYLSTAGLSASGLERLRERLRGHPPS